MNASAFELRLSFPADPRFAETLRDLGAHAARYAGCADAGAEAYGSAVEEAVRACFAAAALSSVPVIVRRGSGPVETLIACDRRVPHAPAADAQITIDWTSEGGRDMCRVAFRFDC